jgi:hypothetical protein
LKEFQLDLERKIALSEKRFESPFQFSLLLSFNDQVLVEKTIDIIKIKIIANY